MAVKDVREYYERMTSDYMEMKRVLEEMEKMSEEQSSNALKNMDVIRDRVRLLEANYKRLSYIMFLLNKPTKKSKYKRYKQSEKKRLDNIPLHDRQEGVEEQNSETIKDLKSFI